MGWVPILAATDEAGDGTPAAARSSAYTEHLLDTARVALSGVTHSVNTPTKDAGNPLFIAGAESSGAWDEDKLAATPFYDADNGWRMLYGGIDGTDYRMGYAISEDGLTWTKPSLGLVSFGGDTDNNLVLDPPGTDAYVHTVYDSLSGKWVSVTQINGAGGNSLKLYTADSPNVTPTLVKTITAGEAYAEAKSIARRPSDGRWVLYYSSGHASQLRSIYAVVSDTPDYLGSWTEFGIISALTAGGQDTQHYSFRAYPVGEILYGFSSRYNKTTEQLDTDLYVSLDGTAWAASKADFIPRGAGGTWDDEIANVVTLVEEADEWHFYYTGAPQNHAAALPRPGRVGRATIDRGRVGQATGTGTVTTDYFHVAPGATLIVNADASGGTLDIELQDLNGDAVDGFAAADFDTITTDSLDHYAAWGQDTIPAGTYRLVVTLASATLYGFELSDAAPAITTGGGGGGTSASDSYIWKPLLDDEGAIVTDGDGDPTMGYAPA